MFSLAAVPSGYTSTSLAVKSVSGAEEHNAGLDVELNAKSRRRASVAG